MVRPVTFKFFILNHKSTTINKACDLCAYSGARATAVPIFLYRPRSNAQTRGDRTMSLHDGDSYISKPPIKCVCPQPRSPCEKEANDRVDIESMKAYTLTSRTDSLRTGFGIPGR